tara:strand:+ start:480 stop:1136 length:657 start_codon:yes stop_codon:yes gene_type:complete
MTNHIKFNSILIFFFTLISVISCSNNEEISTNNDFSITNFKLNQLDRAGRPHFNLSSTKATIDPITNDIEADDVAITIPSKNALFNKINASKALIDKVNNKLYLIDNVKLVGFKDKTSVLYANNIKWNINKQKIFINGNIRLKYMNTYITSSKAIYSEHTNEIVFTGITNYTLYKDNISKFPLINLKADYAKIDNNSKKIEFSSTNSQVESIVNINIK